MSLGSPFLEIHILAKAWKGPSEQSIAVMVFQDRCKEQKWFTLVVKRFERIIWKVRTQIDPLGLLWTRLFFWIRLFLPQESIGMPSWIFLKQTFLKWFCSLVSLRLSGAVLFAHATIQVEGVHYWALLSYSSHFIFICHEEPVILHFSMLYLLD